MTPRERDAVAAIALMAALADGRKDDRERTRLGELFDALDGVSGPALYQRVLLGRTRLDEEAAALSSPELRSFAFEMALAVCDADGVLQPPERDFLDRLRQALGLDPATTGTLEHRAEALAAAPLETPFETAAPPLPPPRPAPALAAAPTAGAPVPAASGAEAAVVDATAELVDDDLDRTIVSSAVLAGALELLPQSLATLAIVPLQMKLVYRIGERYGYRLDPGHVREFLAVAGVGLGSQMVEGYLRKAFGKTVGKALKKTIGKKAGKKAAKLSKGLAGAAITFATTYALGQAARSYYAGGRTLSSAQLRDTFQAQLERGQTVFASYRDEVTARAGSLDMGQLLSLARQR